MAWFISMIRIVKKYGVPGHYNNDIFFTKYPIIGSEIIRYVFTDDAREGSTLNDIKAELTTAAKSVGANAIMNFVYGQRHNKLPENCPIKINTMSLYGQGEAIKLEEYN